MSLTKKLNNALNLLQLVRKWAGRKTWVHISKMGLMMAHLFILIPSSIAAYNQVFLASTAFLRASSIVSAQVIQPGRTG